MRATRSSGEGAQSSRRVGSAWTSVAVMVSAPGARAADSARAAASSAPGRSRWVRTTRSARPSCSSTSGCSSSCSPSTGAAATVTTPAGRSCSDRAPLHQQGPHDRPGVASPLASITMRSNRSGRKKRFRLASSPSSVLGGRPRSCSRGSRPARDSTRPSPLDSSRAPSKPTSPNSFTTTTASDRPRRSRAGGSGGWSSRCRGSLTSTVTGTGSTGRTIPSCRHGIPPHDHHGQMPAAASAVLRRRSS